MIVDNDIKPATNEMIEFACVNFHYAKSVPAGRKMSFAIFEEQKFIGVIIFSCGANNNIGKPFNLRQGECIELTRVALANHKNPVTYYLSRCIKLIKIHSPAVKMIVSYADFENQHHLGKIYQANNWIYLGVIRNSDTQYFYKGKWTHVRTIQGYPPIQRAMLKKTLPQRKNSDKFKYIYPMTKTLMKEWRKKGNPYPKILTECDNNAKKSQASLPI